MVNFRLILAKKPKSNCEMVNLNNFSPANCRLHSKKEQKQQKYLEREREREKYYLGWDTLLGFYVLGIEDA